MKKLMLPVALACCAAAAWSQAPGDTATRGPGNDPNEMVCVNEAQIGSRLAKRRVCRTRAQWEEHRRQMRLAVDKAQMDKQSNFK